MNLQIRLALLIALIVVAGLTGYLLGRPGPSGYERRKLEMIRAVTAQAGTGQMLVVGDSIVEMLVRFVRA